MENLQNYYKKLQIAQDKEVEAELKRTGSPWTSRIDNPEGTCNTLWLPVSTSNRNATLNLNHTLIGFDEERKLWGSNGNCSTRYRIIAAPDFLKFEDLKFLGEKVNEKFENAFPSWNNALRASNADLIASMLKELKKEDLRAPIQAIENATNLKEKELREILIGRILASDHFKQGIEKAVKSGFSPDYPFNNGFNLTFAKNKVLELVKKYFENLTPFQNLQDYYKELETAQEKEVEAELKRTGSRWTSRIDNPEGTCNTLWLPVSTSNKTAVLNLNHTLMGFDYKRRLWGNNADCSTRYRILEAPDFLKNEDLKSLGEKVNEKFENAFPSWNNALRASNADLIASMLEDLKKQDLIEPIQAIVNATSLNEKELTEIFIGRLLVSGHFKQAIEKAVKSGFSPDFGLDKEIESYNEVAATNSVLETLKKYFL